jgi:predicted outer membrane repeat protein
MKSIHQSYRHRCLATLLVAIVCLSLVQYRSASAAIAIDLYVDTPNDSQTNNTGCLSAADTNTCSLRGAIQYIRDTGGTSPYLVHVPSDTYNLTIPGTDDTNALGDLDISGPNITIAGAGMTTTIINGSGNFDRIIDFLGEANLVLMDLTVQHGNLSAGLGGGGGIRALSTGQLTLHNVRVTGNIATGIGAGDAGGGVYVDDADLVVNNSSEINGNTACHGGGVAFANGSVGHTADFTSSVVNSNTASCGNGGGIYVTGPLVIDLSLVDLGFNLAKSGGAYYDSADTTLTMQNVDVFDNDISAGGTGSSGLEVFGTATLNGVAVYQNQAFSGSGAISLNSGSVFTMADSSMTYNGGDTGGALKLVGNTSALLQRVEITHNFSHNGGGIWVGTGGNIDLENVTLAANEAETYGGGLYLIGNSSADLNHVTVARNLGDLGGDAVYIANNGHWSSSNSLFYYSVPGDNCVFAALYVFASYGHNISNDSSCNLIAGTDLESIDPLVGLLVVSGDESGTIPLLIGSPAIDGALVGDPVTTDQLGVVRVDGNGDGIIKSDVGAYEVKVHFFMPLIIKP